MMVVLLCLTWLLLLVPVLGFSPIIPTVPPPESNPNSILTEAQRNIVVLSHNVSSDVANGLFDVNNLLTGRVDVLARCVNSALWVSNGIRKDTNVYLMLFPHNITIEVRGGEVKDLNPDERTTALCLQRTLLAGGNDSDNDQQEQQGQERHQVALQRLQTTDRTRPETENPNKPGSRSKSEKRALRITRKAREAMIRRITRSLGDSPPQGFMVHHDDTLPARLQTLKGSVLMLDELGEPLRSVLSNIGMDTYTYTDTDGHTKVKNSNKVEFESDTTIILGDQIGYAACDEKVMEESDTIRQVSLGPLSLLTSQCITVVHHYLDTREESLSK
jgi:tRNA pseudouridine-54 N-methylase